MLQVEELILGNLEQLAREGFSATAIEAAVNTIEFSLRENNTGSFPRGLSLMLRAAAAWIYDRDPLEPLQWTDDLQRFKASLMLHRSCECHHVSCHLHDGMHGVQIGPTVCLGSGCWCFISCLPFAEREDMYTGVTHVICFREGITRPFGRLMWLEIAVVCLLLAFAVPSHLVL